VVDRGGAAGRRVSLCDAGNGGEDCHPGGLGWGARSLIGEMHRKFAIAQNAAIGAVIAFFGLVCVGLAPDLVAGGSMARTWCAAIALWWGGTLAAPALDWGAVRTHDPLAKSRFRATPPAVCDLRHRLWLARDPPVNGIRPWIVTLRAVAGGLASSFVVSVFRHCFANCIVKPFPSDPVTTTSSESGAWRW